MANTAAPRAAHRFHLGMAIQFWVLAAVLRPLKHLVPLPVLVRAVRFGGSLSRSSTTRADAILEYMNAADRFPRRPPANCLERSLAAYRLLLAAGARPELRVGVLRVDGPRAVVRGHVWLLLNGRPVGESSEAVAQFTPILRFDADGCAERLAPSAATASSERAPLSVP